MVTISAPPRKHRPSHLRLVKSASSCTASIPVTQRWTAPCCRGLHTDDVHSARVLGEPIATWRTTPAGRRFDIAWGVA